ncbi:MAG: LptA/OstA family protein [Acidobacteriota bacterium]
MTAWQRRLRAAIAVFGVGFAVLVYVAIRHGRAPAPPASIVGRVDPGAAAEITGGDSRTFKGENQDFRVEYDRLLLYPDGRQRLQGARVFVDERAGRAFRVTSAEARVGGDQDHLEFSGGVELTSDDGLKASAREAALMQSEGVVRASGPTTFSAGTMTGSSVGLTYDLKRDVLWLLEQARLSLAPDGPDGAPVEISAGSAGLARPDHYARFEGGFTLVHQGRTLQSEQATAYLSDDQSKVQVLEMQRAGRVTGLGEAAGTLRGMKADDLSVEFAEDGHTLRGATLSGTASIDVAGAAAEPRRIAARWIELRLADDGVTVTSLSAREDVRLELPAEGRQGAMTVRADTLAASGEGGGGLSTATFLGGVEYRETPPGSAVTRVAGAESMTLVVAPGFGEVGEARFDGGFSFDEDRVSAQSTQATYRVIEGVVELAGVDDASGRVPRVTDGQAAIEGGTVLLTLEGRKIVATEKVRSVLLPTSAPSSGDASSSTPTRSSMLQADRPVYATAQTLSYDGATRRASYAGGARLWQGDTAIQGDELTIDDATGNLSARGSVRSTLMLERRDEQGGASERQPTIASADSLAYDEASRKATYTRNAHVSGPQGDLRAGRIEVVLSESGAQLVRVEAYTAVTVQVGERQASGDRLTYIDADGRYAMQGVPVRIVAQCRDISGRSLTFYKAADTIIVDGNQEARTQTTGGAPCGERRST